MKKIKLVLLLVVVFVALFSTCIANANENMYVDFLCAYPNGENYVSQIKKITSRNFYDDGTYHDYIREFIKNDSEKTITVYLHGTVETVLYLDDANMVSGYASTGYDYQSHYVYYYDDEITVYEGWTEGDTFHIKEDGSCIRNVSDIYASKSDREYKYDNLGRIVYSKGSNIESWIEYYDSTTQLATPVLEQSVPLRIQVGEAPEFSWYHVENADYYTVWDWTREKVYDDVTVRTVTNTSGPYGVFEDIVSRKRKISFEPYTEPGVYAIGIYARSNNPGKYAQSESFSFNVIVEEKPGSFSPTPQQGQIPVKVNGQEINFDVPPQIINDRTMIPLRAVAEAFGADVTWHEDIKSINIEGKIVKNENRPELIGEIMHINMHIGSDHISYVIENEEGDYLTDGSHFELDSPPVVVNDRTLVPIRAIVELFGYEVDWNENTNTVSIYE